MIISTTRGGRRTVSSMETSNNSNNNGGKSSGKRNRYKGLKRGDSTNETGSFKDEVKAKYYPPHIYRTFTEEQKAVHKKLSEPFLARQKKRALASATTTSAEDDDEPSGAGNNFDYYRPGVAPGENWVLSPFSVLVTIYLNNHSTEVNK